jgi:hypothetical protein
MYVSPSVHVKMFLKRPVEIVLRPWSLNLQFCERDDTPAIDERKESKEAKNYFLFFRRQASC